MLEIASASLRVAVLPDLGGGIARFDWLGHHGPVPLFRPWDGAGTDPNRLACYPLVPWSNRISGGGFRHEGRFWPIAPNVPGEPCPLHGDGWRSPWAVLERAPDRLRLELRSDAVPPFVYRAELAYRLAGATLEVALAVEHLGDAAAPYGLGLHPWLPRTADTTLEAPAGGVWLEGAAHLPAGETPVAPPPDWKFAQAQGLPAGWINNGFTAWPGAAGVRWPDRQVELAIEAGSELGTYILFSPGADCDFFCFEPVSHPVDAFNLPGRPGLRTLRRGERFAATCRFTAAELGR